MSEQEAGAAMADGGERVGRALRDAVERICQSGGGVVLEEYPGALQDTRPPEPVRGMLLAAADALAESLAQLDEATLGLRARPSRATTS
jgi:hypothetical protein